MRDIWSFLLQTLTAAGVSSLLLALKWLFRDKLSPRWQFAAWGILALVLLVPAGRGGRYVLFDWPFYVEALRSVLTGDHGDLAHVTAPIPLAPAGPPRTIADWLFVVYAAGVVFFLLRYLLAYVRLRLALRRGRPADSAPIRAVAEKYGLTVCPAVEIDGLPSAFVCGLFRPVLALPAGGTDEKVLLHELLHLRYKDVAWGIVICLFRCVHWCDPLLWWCADLAGNDLESLCDQRVLERLEGEERRDYGRILLEMADDKYARTPGTSSMANGGGNIRRRIEAIARFKRYPRGMALVSACVLLVLAVPLTVGARAAVPDHPTVYSVPMTMARARTVYCTTYAGALDTYAKAVMTERFDYRAMCAPLSRQDALAEDYLAAAQGRWAWRESGLAWQESGLADQLDTSSGYQIYNLVRTGEDVYEGLLAMTLYDAPEGEEWDGTVHSRWMAVQPLRAEREGDRWVVVPLGDLRAVQGDERVGSNWGLPAQVYEAQAGDFTLQLRRQTTAFVDSYEQNVQSGVWFGSASVFGTVPQPEGEFTVRYWQDLRAVYTGDPAEKGRYHHIAASSVPLWPEDARPDLRDPGTGSGGGGSSDGDEWGGRDLEGDWEDVLFLSGGGAMGGGIPESYAADLYLNGEKAAELTLLPVEGGTSLD